MLKKTIGVGVFVFVMLINLAVILFYFDKRDGMHVDELFSYGHSNSSVGAFMYDGIDHFFEPKQANVIKNRWISTEDFKKYVTVDEENKFSYGRIVENLRKDVHPPLYYFLLHSVCSLGVGEFSKWFGGAINVICFLLIMIVLGRFFKLFIEDEKYFWIVLALWGGSNIGISTFLYIRMYALQCLLFVLILYEMGKIVKYNKASGVELGLVFLYFSLGLITHYNSILFLAVVSGVSGVVLLKRKNFSLLFKLLGCFIGSFFILFLVVPYAKDVLLYSQRGSGAIVRFNEVVGNLFGVLDGDFYRFIKIYMFDFFNIREEFSFAIVSCLVICCNWFYFRNKLFKNNVEAWFLNACYLVVLFLACFYPVGCLVGVFVLNFVMNNILFCDEKSDNIIKSDETDLFLWGFGVAFLYVFVVFIIVPFMREFEARYIMGIMPLVAVLTIEAFIRLGRFLKIKEKVWYVILAIIVIFNCLQTDFGTRSVFRFQNDKETTKALELIKDKDVFVISHYNEPLLFFGRIYYLMRARNVYVVSSSKTKGFMEEVYKNRKAYVLVLDKTRKEEFFGVSSQIDKNQELKNLLIKTGVLKTNQKRYTLYKIKGDDN